MDVHFIGRGDTVRTPDGVGLVVGSWGVGDDTQHRVRVGSNEPKWYPRSELVWPAANLAAPVCDPGCYGFGCAACNPIQA
jgi:hypothetical protein